MVPFRVHIQMREYSEDGRWQTHIAEALESHAGERFGAWALESLDGYGTYFLVRDDAQSTAPAPLILDDLEAEMDALFAPGTPWGDRLGAHMAPSSCCLARAERAEWIQRLTKPVAPLGVVMLFRFSPHAMDGGARAFAGQGR